MPEKGKLTVMIRYLEHFRSAVLNKEQSPILLIDPKRMDAMMLWLKQFSMQRRISVITFKELDRFIPSRHKAI